MKALNSSRILIKKNKITIFFLFIISYLLFLFEFKEFILWSQITEFYEISSIFSIKAHTIRILLINGLIYLVHFFFSVDRILAFNITVHVILFFSTVIFSKIVYESITKKIFLIILISIIPIIISFFQNGRGIFGCFSILLLFYTLSIKNVKLKWISLLVAAIFSNVSSGIFSVLIITIVLGALNKSFFFIKKKHLIFILFLTLPLFIIYLDKNLKFYDYDLFKLLSHGLGIIFHVDYIILLPLGFIFFTIIFLISFYLIINPKIIYTIEFPFITASIIGLFFGFSSFNCFIYVYLLLFLQKLNFVQKNKLK